MPHNANGDFRMDQPDIAENIFAVSLDSYPKHRAAAILYANGRLFISHCVPIAAKGGWREKLKQEIAEKVNDGFVVILEDRSGVFSPHANAFCFEDLHEGRTMLQHAFDWWFSLKNSGNLVLDDSVRRFDMNPRVDGAFIDMKNDDKGRVMYVPAWDNFTGAHKALLLCVLAAKMEPLSEHWFDAFMGAMPPLPKEEWNLLERWGKSMKNWENEEQVKIERMRAERQFRIDERDGAWPL